MTAAAHDALRVDVGRIELGAGAEVRAHRALGVGANDHEAPARGGAVGRGRNVELHPDAPQVVREHLAEGVIGDPADER